MQVVCAWPVSGQYGPGPRILYYILVVTFVFARKAEWLRNACLATALLSPAAAAVHAIVLAALHVDGAVDMDIYGAFQFCSIGILAAPLTVRLSRTYFSGRGRTTIFVWTGLILGGLLSLTVEFYRSKPSDCTHDDSGNLINANQFPYGDNTICGLNCNKESSPMRQGSDNNIYLIPAPVKLTFGTTTLLAALCCVPAFLSLVLLWNKMLEINWKQRFDDGGSENLIKGTNGATVNRMKSINDMRRLFLTAVEVPIFAGAVLAILILGEMNLFSSQMFKYTEPVASIGQWAPIVATVGSLYLLLIVDVHDAKEDEESHGSIYHCNCSHHHAGSGQSLPNNVQPEASHSGRAIDARSINTDMVEHPPEDTMSLSSMPYIASGLRTASSHSLAIATPTVSRMRPRASNRLMPMNNGTEHRRKIAKAVLAVGRKLSSVPDDDESEFKRGKAVDFPEIPGEEMRNRALPQIRRQYNQPRNVAFGVLPMLREQRSRPGSFIGSFTSDVPIEDGANTPRTSSPDVPQVVSLPTRRDTLEVPSPVDQSQDSMPQHPDEQQESSPEPEAISRVSINTNIDSSDVRGNPPDTSINSHHQKGSEETV